MAVLHAVARRSAVRARNIHLIVGSASLRDGGKVATACLAYSPGLRAYAAALMTMIGLRLLP